jgi:hypothetical protein
VQFKVPQNIDMADRIVGPLTLVQFLYVLVGGIIDYALFSTLGPTNPSLFLIIAVPVALFALALAFLKIQDQTIPKFVLSFFVYLVRPKVRMWQKEGLEAEIVITPKKVEKKEEVTGKIIKKSEIDTLTQILDTGGQLPPEQRQAVVARQVAAAATGRPPMLVKRPPSLDLGRKPNASPPPPQPKR